MTGCSSGARLGTAGGSPALIRTAGGYGGEIPNLLTFRVRFLMRVLRFQLDIESLESYNVSMDTKYCKRCDETLLVSEFTQSASRYDGLQAYCKNCMKEYRKEHYRANKKQYYDRNEKSKAKARQYVLDIKNTTACKDCGVVYKDEPWLVEFDHLPGFEKKRSISEWVNGYGLGQGLISELEKCELVCLICHRRRTAKRGGWKDNRLSHLLN